MTAFRALALAVGMTGVAGSLAAQPAAPPKTSLDAAFIAGMRWRNIGPANMMGRIADIEGIPSPSKTFYVSTAAGGIWKTTNAGVTFGPVFETRRAWRVDGRPRRSPRRTRTHLLAAPASRTRATRSRRAAASTRAPMAAGRWTLPRPQGDASHRPHPGASRPTRTPCGVAALGACVETEQGARPLQDHRRRQDLDADEVHQRQGGLRRRAARPDATRTSSGPRARSACAARTS